MARVVIDTNVWVSALISRLGHPARILEAWRKGQIELVTSPPLEEEIAEILRRPKIRAFVTVPENEIEKLIALIPQRAHRIPVEGRLALCRDPKDDMLLETAIVGRARYLVSGDKDVLESEALLECAEEHNIVVITPKDFAVLLEEGTL